MRPKFSIAIPAFDRADYLRQAISSCLAQTVEDFEIIVSDDCSAEDLESIVESFHDRRICYHRSEKRLGASSNHQMAVSLSEGRYVITLNSDDMLVPNCLEVAGRALDQRPEAAAVYFSYTFLDKNEIRGFAKMPNVEFANAADLQRRSWLSHFHGTGPSNCLFRREVFNQVGGYRTSLRLAYDWELYTRFLQGSGVIFLPSILSIYRLHEEQMVQTSSVNGLWDMLDLLADRSLKFESYGEISSLVVAQCGIKIRSSEGIRGVGAMLKEIHRRGLTWPIIMGLPGAILSRVLARLGISTSDSSAHYIDPIDADMAVTRSNIAWQNYKAANNFFTM